MLKFPSKEEQNKIASFLSVIDEKFGKEQEKLTILRAMEKIPTPTNVCLKTGGINYARHKI